MWLRDAGAFMRELVLRGCTRYAAHITPSAASNRVPLKTSACLFMPAGAVERASGPSPFRSTFS